MKHRTERTNGASDDTRLSLMLWHNNILGSRRESVTEGILQKCLNWLKIRGYFLRNYKTKQGIQLSWVKSWTKFTFTHMIFYSNMSTHTYLWCQLEEANWKKLTREVPFSYPFLLKKAGVVIFCPLKWLPDPSLFFVLGSWLSVCLSACRLPAAFTSPVALTLASRLWIWKCVKRRTGREKKSVAASQHGQRYLPNRDARIFATSCLIATTTGSSWENNYLDSLNQNVWVNKASSFFYLRAQCLYVFPCRRCSWRRTWYIYIYI